MSSPRPYQVYVYAGSNPQTVDSARVVDITPDTPCAKDMIDKVSACGLTSADLRARAVFVVDPDATGDMAAKSLLAYVAMLGLARRRLDVAFGFEGSPVVMADLDTLARNLPDGGKPSEPAALLKVAGKVEVPEDFEPDLVLSSRMSMQDVTAVRYAKRVSYVPPDSVTSAMPQFIAMASMRARGEAERLPSLILGDVEVDCEAVRKAAEGLRRSLRGDNRSAVVPPVPVPEYVYHLEQASHVDMLKLLEALGASSRTVQVPVKDADGNPTGELTDSTVWHCLHPENHAHGDATPSARVTFVDSKSYFRCFRCLPEKVDPLRLVMWTKGWTADESADWILANVV